MGKAEFLININNLRNSLDSVSGNNFNSRVSDCLKSYCRRKSLTGHATRQQGGDFGTDFYIEETNEYFQMYSGQGTSINDISKKFKDDLNKLLRNLADNKYTGKLDKFYFVFSTRDIEKPNDPNAEIEKIIAEAHKHYYPFDYYLWNVSDFVDGFLTNVIELNDIEFLNGKFGTFGNNRQIEIMEELREILEQSNILSKSSIPNYTRISTTDKLIKHSLEVHDAQINQQIVDNDFFSRISFLASDIDFSDKFENYKENVIFVYYQLVEEGYRDQELFDELINRLISPFNSVSYETMYFLVLFILDRCDIFSD